MTWGVNQSNSVSITLLVSTSHHGCVTLQLGLLARHLITSGFVACCLEPEHYHVNMLWINGFSLAITVAIIWESTAQ